MDVLKKLEFLRDKNEWTNYRLAKNAGLSETTIANIYKRNNLPSLDTLETICKAFGLSLSQFFVEDNEELVALTQEQREMFDEWSGLTKEQKLFVNEFIKLLYKSNN